MENRAELNWNENEETDEVINEATGEGEDSRESFNQIFNQPRKTPGDNIRALWQNVLLLSVEYATGKITNDHDCGGKEEIKQQIRKSSIRFLLGNGNLKLACEAAGLPISTVQNMGKKYEYLLREQHV
jgi:hypothetical protein